MILKERALLKILQSKFVVGKSEEAKRFGKDNGERVNRKVT
jgi:hypothetical protein